MPRFISGRHSNLCRSLTLKNDSSKNVAVLHPNYGEHKLLRNNRRVVNRRYIGSVYISLPGQLNSTQCRRIRLALNSTLDFYDLRLSRILLDNNSLRNNGYDELAAAKIERQCGLPLPSIFKRKEFKSSPEVFNVNTEDGSTSLWEEKTVEFGKLPGLYLQLSKARLSTLVVVTALGGYAICPGSFHLNSFLGCVIGTYLTAFSANSINQCLESPFDAQMKRTQNRVLPRHVLSTFHAASFGISAGVLGTAILYLETNPLTAALALSNILLYTVIYTPMKRYSIYNTWVGSLVGAIPPIMGWTACSGSLDVKSLVFAAILFAWQFPHFNALSWNLRADYSKAGYCMMAASRPDLLRRTALTYSASLVATSSVVAPYIGLTSWTFALTSLPLNLYFTLLAYRFYKNTDSKNSKKLFRCSLFYLPVLMALMLLSKPSPPSDAAKQRDGSSALTSHLREMDCRRILKWFHG